MEKRRGWVRQTTRGIFTSDTINVAIDLMEKEGFSLRAASRIYNPSHKILGRYIEKKKNGVPVHHLSAQYGYKTWQVFNPDLEDYFVEYIKLRAKIYYEMTTDVQKAAYTLAKGNNVAKVLENWEENECAGLEWYKQFHCRHPSVSLKKPESCSLSQTTSFNKANVNSFFNIYKTSYANTLSLEMGYILTILMKQGWLQYRYLRKFWQIY